MGASCYNRVMDILCSILLLAVATAETERPFGTVAELATYQRSVDYRGGRSFDITGRITALVDWRGIVLEDETGRILLHSRPYHFPKPGDEVRVTGETSLSDLGYRFSFANAFAVRGHRPPPEPVDATAAEIMSGTMNNRKVRLRGTVIDAFVDEIDRRWYYMAIKDASGCVYAHLRSQDVAREKIDRLVGARVEVTDVCVDTGAGLRQFIGPRIHLNAYGNIRVLEPAPSDPFDVPSLEPDCALDRGTLSRIDRRKVRGAVVAVWGGGRLIVRTDDGRRIFASLANDVSVPACDDRVEVVGHPETDFYRINLMHADVRVLERHASAAPPPERISPKALFLNRDGQPEIQPNMFGEAVTLAGTVRSLPAPGNADGRLNLESERFNLPVDVSACPEVLDGLAPDCQLEITGIVFLESESWHPGGALPRIRGCSLIVRRPTDIRVLTAPPWWTRQRLFWATVALLGLVTIVGIWNLALRRLAERRGRSLFQAEIDRVSSDLKVGERTRLAVELHDSIAQTLTGVSYQVSAALRAGTSDPVAERHHLGIALQMLGSSRTELRRCIWDLKSEALEEKDFAVAVRKTVETVTSGADVSIRFNIPRSRLSDTTAHAILRIVRELAANAVRHGRATHLRIAGSIDGGVLRFSVRDNGCGFDPASASGPDHGHFGLDGIRERTRQLGGNFKIESEPGLGARAEVSIRLTHGTEEPSE